MPKFSNKSLERLSQCDNRIQKVFKEVIKYRDCTILEGYRDKDLQDEYLRAGKSKVKWPNGKHNKKPSKAIDVVPYFKARPHIRWNDKLSFYYFSGFVLGIATSLGITLRHGGNWDMDDELNDQSFFDLPHFELLD